MNQQTVHETIMLWINSCITEEQVEVTQKAVTTLYDIPYLETGSHRSEQLHEACREKMEEIKYGHNAQYILD